VTEWKHGLFAYAVMQALQGAQLKGEDETDQADVNSIDVDKLYHYVSLTVSARNGAQHPTLEYQNREIDIRLPIVTRADGLPYSPHHCEDDVR
jgi:hypothetical protein